MCALRDGAATFRAAGAVVLGISGDGPEAQRRFAEAQGLPFRLLSDTAGEVRRRYGVPRTLGILPGRTTYVIDGSGVVRHVETSQVAFGRHATTALEAVRRLGPASPAGPPAGDGQG